MMFGFDWKKDKVARVISVLSIAIAIIIVTAAIISFIGGINIGASNHFGQLPVVRRVLDPSYLPGDFSIELRLYHHRAFTYLIAGLSLLVGEDNALIILSFAGMGLLAYSLWRLCSTAGISLAGYITAGIVLSTNFMWMGKGLELNQFSGDASIMPPTFAHALVLLALAETIRERYYRASFLAGLAALFHLQIGLICGVALAPIYLFNTRRLGFRGLAVSAVLFLLAASPGLADLVALLGSGLAGGSSGEYTRAFYIDFRHPHHFELLSTTAAFWIAAYLAVQILIWRWMRREQGRAGDSARVFAWVSLALVLYSLLHFADYYLVRDDRLATIQFIRLSPLISVIGFLSLLIWAQSRLKSSRFIVACSVMILAAILWGAYQVRIEAKEFNPGISRYADKTSTWVRVCQWIKSNGPVDAVYITPPGLNGFTSLSDRSTIADFKNNPDGGRKMAEWFERLKDLAGGTLPTGRGFENRDLLNEACNTLTADQLIGVARKYRAEFAVVSSKREMPFEVLYRNQRYQVLRIYDKVR